ncbi:hypothetical protein [Streptomyces cadmiisoli]|uniref:hypothetical protein n=1 Tax=Streptomyces cadmiisoli TaxID=2184053 RepID=UPI003D74A48D
MKERPLVKSLAAEQSADAALGVLSHFSVEFYDCFYTRADALFELTDAVLCSDGPVTEPPPEWWTRCYWICLDRRKRADR